MRQRSNQNLINECLTKSSLNLSNGCFIKQGFQKYLEDKDFNRARLKLQTRVNILPLKDMLYRIDISNDNKFELCADNNVDNISCLTALSLNMKVTITYANFKIVKYQAVWFGLIDS